AVSIESFRNLIISDKSGAQILLRDVAIVEDGMEDKRRVARVNGLPAMGLAIRKIRGANAVDVAHAVKAKLAVLQQRLPDGIEMARNYDATISVEDAIKDIQIALALAVPLTAAVCCTV